jgi:hypothetical protein
MMNKIKNINKYGVLQLLVLTACATPLERINEDYDSNEVEKVFNLDEKTLNKFSIRNKENSLQIQEISKNSNNKSLQNNLNENPVKKDQKVKSIISNDLTVSSKNQKKDLIEVEKLNLNSSQSSSSQNFFNLNNSPKMEINSEILNYPLNFPSQLVEYDKNSSKYWNQFDPIVVPKEELKFMIKYFGVNCGEVTITTHEQKKIGNNMANHYKAHMKSAPFYRYLYELDDYIESFVDTESHLPMKYVLIQRESGQSVDDLQLFDSENYQTKFWYKRIKNGETKEINETQFIPKYFQDSFSALFFVRGLPLKQNDKFEFPIVTRGKIWLLRGVVDKYEVLTINNKKYDALRIKAETEFPGVLKKRGDILFWYSADQAKKLLKFSAQVKIGRLDGVLVE